MSERVFVQTPSKTFPVNVSAQILAVVATLTTVFVICLIIAMFDALKCMKKRVELQSVQISSLVLLNNRNQMHTERLNDHDFILEHTTKILAMLCENQGWSVEHIANTVDNPNFHIG